MVLCAYAYMYRYVMVCMYASTYMPDTQDRLLGHLPHNHRLHAQRQCNAFHVDEMAHTVR